MSDLFGNHIVGFPTRRLVYLLTQIYKKPVPDVQSASLVLPSFLVVVLAGHGIHENSRFPSG